MKAKTFLILWLIGFLFVVPKWMQAAEAVAKARIQGSDHAQSTASLSSPKTCSVISVR